MACRGCGFSEAGPLGGQYYRLEHRPERCRADRQHLEAFLRVARVTSRLGRVHKNNGFEQIPRVNTCYVMGLPLC